VSRVPACK